MIHWAWFLFIVPVSFMTGFLIGVLISVASTAGQYLPAKKDG